LGKEQQYKYLGKEVISMFAPVTWRRGDVFGWLPEVQRLQRDMNRLFVGLPTTVGAEYPAINVWSGEHDYILTAELPGIDPAQLDISVAGDTLTFSGSQDSEVLREGETYHRQERNSGRFSKTLQLPFQIDAEKVAAQYEKGILKLTLPIASAEKPRKIAIRAE
jgi:HSP20 family protein